VPLLVAEQQEAPDFLPGKEKGVGRL